MLNTKIVAKTIDLITLSSLLLFGSGLFSVATNATATQAVNFDFQVGIAGTKQYADSINLQANDIARFRMQVGNLFEDNKIDVLTWKSEFPTQVNPTSVKATVYPDRLPSQLDTTPVTVPAGYKLNYVSGSTYAGTWTGAEWVFNNLSDRPGGVSPLLSGTQQSNVESGQNKWYDMTFDMKVVPEDVVPPQLPPKIEFFKYIANLSKGEALDSKKTSTSIGPNEEVAVRLIVHNYVIDSVAHNVKVYDQLPSGISTPQTLTGKVTSDETGQITSGVQLSLGLDKAAELVPGSGRIFTGMSDTVGVPLSDNDLAKLFSAQGLSLNPDNNLKGCLQYAKKIEFKLTMKPKIGEQPGKLKILKFDDKNRNKIWEGGEELLPGWSFKVVGKNVDQVVVTSVDGVVFVELPAGVYTVSEQDKDGWEAITEKVKEVTISPNQLTEVRFGNAQKPAVSELPPTGVNPLLVGFAFSGLGGMSGLGFLMARYRYNLKAKGAEKGRPKRIGNLWYF